MSQQSFTDTNFDERALLPEWSELDVDDATWIATLEEARRRQSAELEAKRRQQFAELADL